MNNEPNENENGNDWAAKFRSSVSWCPWERMSRSEDHLVYLPMPVPLGPNWKHNKVSPKTPLAAHLTSRHGNMFNLNIQALTTWFQLEKMKKQKHKACQEWNPLNFHETTNQKCLCTQHTIDDYLSDSILQHHPNSITQIGRETRMKKQNMRPPTMNTYSLMATSRLCFFETFCCNILTCFFTLRTQSMISNLSR